MNITLIGMAGAGKSHIGKHLAEQLEFDLVDSDELLAEKFGKSIQDLLDELGVAKYVNTEAALHIERTRGRDHMVLAPAGSVIYSDTWLDHIKDISEIVYLRVPYEVVEARLRDVPPRAIIGLGQKSLRQLYDERSPLYAEHSDYIVDTHERSLGQVLDAIVSKLGLRDI